ncbi:YlbF family regulator [Paenibacillaceae bacterium]|nr:YlbF family regulator [Paenibacillaceae bacterium]
MNVYDKAYELAKAMRESQESTDLKAARQAVEADSDAKRLMDDFRERQTGFQQMMMAGEEPTDSEMETMNTLYEELSLNPVINQLFEAERRLAVVFDDVNKILTDSLNDLVK